MRLELSRSVIRSYEPADVPAVVEHANDRAVWRNMRDSFPHPYTREDARSWIEHARTSPRELHFAIEVEGEAAGAIGCVPFAGVHRHVAELGYWLGRACWGRGIMTEAVVAFTDWLDAHFDFVRLEAPVYAWNPASARVLEKAGYTCEAVQAKRVLKDETLVDQWLYVKLR